MATLISTQSASGSAVTFSSIPNTYASLTLVADGASHNNTANAQPKISLSADGVNFSAAQNIGSQAAASAGYNGAVSIPAYTGDKGQATGGFAPITSPGIGASFPFVWNCTGGISALRVSLSAGSFDAGTFSLYGE